MSATAGPTTVTAGDPITVRVQISGRGALDAVTLPAAGCMAEFQNYPAHDQAGDQRPVRFQRDKNFEQIVSPENPDVHELPPLTFSFFNPDDGRYHTLTEPAVPLTVQTAGASPMPTIAATKNAAPENQTPQDILPIKENLGTLGRKPKFRSSRSRFSSPRKSVPVLAFLAAFIWRKRADSWRTIRACAVSAPWHNSSPAAWTI